jgi:hypothetical protein
MLRNKLVRSNGSIIDSSVIISCEYTEEVNNSTNLILGDVTASEISVEILSTQAIQQDEVLTYYIIEDGVETKIGVFNADKPTVASRNSMRFSAYDNMARTEKNFSGWLRENQNQFPMELITLATHACSYCGLTLATTDLPYVGMAVNAFYADNITCRQILSWIGSITGQFIRANAEGEVEFAWYKNAQNITISGAEGSLTDDGAGNMVIESGGIAVTDDGRGNVTINSEVITVTDDGKGAVKLVAKNLKVMAGDADVTLGDYKSFPYYQGALTYENYTTDPAERVQINHSEDDVGVIYPEGGDGNCFTITGNMILGSIDTEHVRTIGYNLYTQLKSVSYVPCSVTIPRTIQIRAGDIVTIVDSNDKPFSTYVMKVEVTPSGTRLTSTGDKSYGSNAAVASEKYSNLTGKILEIQKDVDGLRIKAEDLQGHVSGLELNTEHIMTYVEETFVSGDEFSQYRTEAEQTAESFEQRFTRVEGSLEETTAHIKSGLLDHKENGDPIIGIEVGQRDVVNGEETFNKYARFTADRLSFYDANDTEVSYIGDYKQVITNAKVLEKLEVGKFVFDTSNGIALRWEE